MDALTIRAVACELLHAHEAMSPVAIAEAAGVTALQVCGALGDDHERFARVAGEGCWWWKLHPLVGMGRKRSEPLPDDGAATRAWRQRVAVRERIRGALRQEPGGITLKRIAAATGLAGAEIADQLLGLRALGEVSTFTIPGMAGFEFWKETAA
jgi:hypothetical protein